MVERVLCKHEVVGSIPSDSTILLRPSGYAGLSAKSFEASGEEGSDRGSQVSVRAPACGGKSDIVN